MSANFEYEGAVGKTERGSVHLPMSDGTSRVVDVFTSVNVKTDPALQQLALSGGLHVFDSGERLAIPFVYHDPDARKFALVIPESIRHLALKERADCLVRIAKDSHHPVPAYVSSVDAVIGTAELATYLSSDASTHRSDKERELEDRERRTLTGEQVLKARELDMQRFQSKLASLRVELTERESQQEQRSAELRRAEDAAGTASGLADEVKKLKGEVASLQQALESAQRTGGNAAASDIRRGVEAEIGPMGRTQVVAFSLEDEVSLVEDASGSNTAVSMEDVEEILDESDVEELDPVEDVDELDAFELVEDFEEGSADHHAAVSTPKAKAPVTVPMTFLSDPGKEMASSIEEGEPWVFVRLDESQKDAFATDESELLVQYVSVDGYPVVLLALLDSSGQRPFVRRAAFDPKNAADIALLEQLKDNGLKANVAMFDAAGGFLVKRVFEAPNRVPNLSMILERCARSVGSNIDAQTALERAMAAPPPARLSNHPFHKYESAPNIKSTIERVALLAKWSAPNKLDLALLGLSIPRETVDGGFKGILSDAVKYGAALTPKLIARAVSLGVATEPGELVAKQFESFVTHSNSGLSSAVVANNWERLLTLAEEYEVAVDADVYQTAHESLRVEHGRPEEDQVSVEQLGAMASPELITHLNHPLLRKDVCQEIVKRRELAHLVPVYRAIRKMNREDVLASVPSVLVFGDEAGDVLIDGLKARKTFVRQASALGLGELSLRRSISPLVHLLQSEPTAVWQEVARVIARFGSSAIRPLVRAIKSADDQDRFSYALAHLRHSGLKKEVEALEDDPSPKLAAAALQAKSVGELVERHVAAVVGQRSIEGDDPIRAFSHRFYQELNK